MKRRARIALPILVVAIGILGAGALIRSRPEVERTSPPARPPLIRVMQVIPTDLSLTVESQGTVRPRVESSLVAQIGGRIEWVSPQFAEGGFFKHGEDLVRIEDRDFRLAVRQAEAQVAQALVRVELEQAEAELAREEWTELVEGEPSALALREPQLAEAKARLEAAQATLEQAELDLQRTRIRAPFDGRVHSTLVDLGQFVGRGTPLAQIYATDAVEVRLPVTRDQLAYLELGPNLSPAADRISGPSVSIRGSIGNRTYIWQGAIVRSGSQFDPQTRMLPLFARVEDPYGRASEAAGAPLPVGLFVEAEIEGRKVSNAVVVPREALRDRDQVLVVDDEERLRFRTVEPFRIERDDVVLTGGLQEGERICISPLDSVTEGMLVRTIEEVGLQTDAGREETL